MRMRLILWAVIIITTLFALVGVVGAVTTGAATAITSNSTILSGTGCSGSVCWFEYGLSSGTKYPWRSYNCTAVGGAFSTEIAGLPLLPGKKFYYRAIDANGDRGSEASFTLLPPVTYAEPTFGQHVENITRYRWRIPIIATEIPGPYTDVTPLTAFTGMMFFFLYAGIWISGRNVFYPVVVFGTTSFFMMMVSMTSFGMPPEFINLSQGIFIASIAGVIFWLFKR